SHIVRHQRTYDAIAAAVDLRTRLRDGSDIVAADLRGSSPVGDSLLVASDTAIEFYSAIGTSTLCASPAPNRITLPPDTLVSGRTLSSWVATPDTGDYVVVLEDSSATSGTAWRRARIVAFGSVATSIGCPASAGLLSVGDVASPTRSYQATFAPAVSINAHRGAPVRVVRRVRYSVYRGGDGKWYLGYRPCTGGCAAIQPVSGPYESHAGAPMSFRYFTRNGAPLAGKGPTADVGRVEIVSRAKYTRPLRLPGMAIALSGDSTIVTVTLRNRW
ncbi:MAG: hypothetical protein ABI229_02115, partial [Gemmatimonadaceae bacterium]